MKKPSTRATIADVAKKAGVSVTTVSRAINSKELVNAETYSRILDAMYKLGYPIPEDANTPAVKKGKRVVIVNTPTAGHAFYHEIFRGITEAANRYGWFVILNEEYICESSYKNFITLLTNCNALGLITTNGADRQSLERISKKFPVIQCIQMTSPDLPYVGYDDNQAMLSAINYLLSIGHKKIAFLTGSETSTDENMDSSKRIIYQRSDIVVQALSAAGVEIDPNFIVDIHGPLHYSFAYNSFSSFLDRGYRPDAVLGVVDTVAYAAVLALQDHGFNVPKDCAVIGFDNVSISEMCRPALSTVSIPRHEIGFYACNMLHSLCINPEDTNINIQFKTELILRDST